MPYVMIQQNGKKVNSALIFTKAEVEVLASKSSTKTTFKFVNTTTRRTITVRGTDPHLKN